MSPFTKKPFTTLHEEISHDTRIARREKTTTITILILMLAVTGIAIIWMSSKYAENNYEELRAMQN